MHPSSFLAWLPLALALLVAAGYLWTRRRPVSGNRRISPTPRDLRRAQSVVRELEEIAADVRKSLASHQVRLNNFEDHLARLSTMPEEEVRKELCRDAEELVKPTLKLATQLANAYDEIRQQSGNLMAFSELRTDPLTGVNNRRGLDETLTEQFAVLNRYGMQLSMAIFDIDHFKRINDQEGHLQGDRILKDLARVLDEHARQTDVVARYGGEEFVVLMPHTDLEGAGIFNERLRATIEQEMPITVSGGIAMALDGDTPESLIARADSALYAAKAAGRNSVFRHTGEQVESVVEDVPISTG